ncbi:MAG: hypothetical protein MH472_01695 [Bacteroidia bacterium]|nr:hypothetical protein [Bacteroidia bacterium]
MKNRIIFIFSLVLVFFAACKKMEVIVPSYIYLSPSTLITKADNSQGVPSSKIEDYYVFQDGSIRGLFYTNSRIPIQATGKNKFRISPGIKYNGMAEQRILYPMLNHFDFELDLQENKVDTVKPVFSYVSNAVFPLVEDYDGSGLALEYNPSIKQFGDTLIRDNGPGAHEPGKFSGKIEMKSNVPNSNLELYSKVFNNWPRFTPFYIELDYKGNIPIIIGMYATSNNGDVTKTPFYVLNPKDEWNKLYLDIESDINVSGSGMQYRIFINFPRGSVSNPEAWIDNFKVIYLD